MKIFYFLITPLLLHSLVACSVSDGTTTSSSTNLSKTYQSYEDAAKKPEAKITHDNNWTIISTTENEDRVYWFLAPDINKVSPALFKKTIRNLGPEQETKTVSDCEAPKQVCDDLMSQFKTLSEKYK
jgi:hypothetical protein